MIKFLLRVSRLDVHCPRHFSAAGAVEEALAGIDQIRLLLCRNSPAAVDNCFDCTVGTRGRFDTRTHCRMMWHFTQKCRKVLSKGYIADQVHFYNTEQLRTSPPPLLKTTLHTGSKKCMLRSHCSLYLLFCINLNGTFQRRIYIMPFVNKNSALNGGNDEWFICFLVCKEMSKSQEVGTLRRKNGSENM